MSESSANARKEATDRWVIELILDNKEDADLAYTAIEKLLVEMGEIGRLCIWRRTRNWPTEIADAGR